MTSVGDWGGPAEQKPLARRCSGRERGLGVTDPIGQPALSAVRPTAESSLAGEGEKGLQAFSCSSGCRKGEVAPFLLHHCRHHDPAKDALQRRPKNKKGLRGILLSSQLY